MAAPRARCTHCGDPFDRRAVNQCYCFKQECRRARNAEKVRLWREARGDLGLSEDFRWHTVSNRTAAA